MVAIPYKSLKRQYIFDHKFIPSPNVHPAKVYWRLKEYEQDPYFHYTVIVRFMGNGHVRSPPADCLAAPINHGGKVNSKDIGMHAQQPINLLRTTRQPCCS